MGLSDVKDKTAIVGVGATKVERDPQADLLQHLGVALERALDDAGLTRHDIDGIMLNIVPPHATMDKLPEMLGLQNITYAFQSWTHGRMQPVCLSTAAMAVYAGQANYVACMSVPMSLGMYRHHYAGTNAGENVESVREGGGPHLETPHYGLITISGGAAMAMQKYFNKCGGT